MRWFALLILFAPCLAAHPLDDQAQMLSEVVIVDDQRLELVLDFRYLSVLASYSEFSGTLDSPGLDADGNGEVSADELKRRFNLLVDELTFAFGISVDGEPVQLEADFERFRFKDMENPGIVDFATPYPIHSTRIHYRFVFAWTADQPLSPGDHRVEYYFSGHQTVVHTPAEQMLAFDARVEPRVRLSDVSYDVAMQVFPKLIFTWKSNRRKLPIQPGEPIPEGWVAPPEELPSSDYGGMQQREYVERDFWDYLPALLTLLAGSALALVGLLTAGRILIVNGRLDKPDRKSPMMHILFVVAGIAIILGALSRLDLLPGL